MSDTRDIAITLGISALLVILGYAFWSVGKVVMESMLASNVRVQQARQLDAALLAEQEKIYKENQPKIEVIDTHFYNDPSKEYAYYEGEIKNISGEPLENVEAVVSYYNANNEFICSETGLIEYLLLKPGQTSPFKVMSKHNSQVAKGSVGFKNLNTNEKIITHYSLR